MSNLFAVTYGDFFPFCAATNIANMMFVFYFWNLGNNIGGIKEEMSYINWKYNNVHLLLEKLCGAVKNIMLMFFFFSCVWEHAPLPEQGKLKWKVIYTFIHAFYMICCRKASSSLTALTSSVNMSGKSVYSVSLIKLCRLHIYLV